LKDILKDLLVLIRYPFMKVKTLIEVVKPLNLVSKELYIQAFEYMANPENFDPKEIQFRSRNNIFANSLILTFQQKKTLKSFLPEKSRSRNWKKIYTASTDGWLSSDFHSICDKRGPTITIIKVSNSVIFGGFNEDDW
jgi:hypothetical protein